MQRCVCVREREWKRIGEREKLIGCKLHICFLPVNSLNRSSGEIRCGRGEQNRHINKYTPANTVQVNYINKYAAGLLMFVKIKCISTSPLSKCLKAYFTDDV